MTALTPSERQTYDMITRHLRDNPRMTPHEVAYTLGLSSTHYYNARAKLANMSQLGVEAIRPGEGLLKRKDAPRRTWDAQQLRWRSQG